MPADAEFTQSAELKKWKIFSTTLMIFNLRRWSAACLDESKKMVGVLGVPSPFILDSTNF